MERKGSSTTFQGLHDISSHQQQNKIAILLEEVDGISGNEDRGGAAAVLDLLGKARVPLLATCNDRYTKSMRSLVPKMRAIDMRALAESAMRVLANRATTVSLASSFVKDAIQAARGDARKLLQDIDFWGRCKTTRFAGCTKDDISDNPFDSTRRLFHSDTTLEERNVLAFEDTDMIPLFVQENYTKFLEPRTTARESTVLDALERTAEAADDLSASDMIGRRIARSQDWSLWETQMYFAVEAPSTRASSGSKPKIDFPALLGKMSSARSMSGSIDEWGRRVVLPRESVSLKGSLMVPPKTAWVELATIVWWLLESHAKTGTHHLVDFLKDTRMMRPDVDLLSQVHDALCTDPNRKRLLTTAQKSALTRQLNKNPSIIPGSKSKKNKAVSKKKASSETH
jgi:replication factor C subunit 1